MVNRAHILVLAAGKGSRMKSAKPKVLHEIAGCSMLKRVLNTSSELDPERTQIIVGFGADQIASELGSDLDYVHQREQLGTGHAVQCAAADIKDDAVVLILYGDVPLVKADTLRSVLDLASQSGLSLLTIDMLNPHGYGRILRAETGGVTGIVEQKDATSEQLLVTEVNTGILAAKGKLMRKWLAALTNDNAQGEYYLTDIVEMAVVEGVEVKTTQPAHEWEVAGANSRQQLAELERCYQRAQAEYLMDQGLTILDPARFDLRGALEVGVDSSVDVNVVIEGRVSIGNRVRIGPNCIIKDTQIQDDAVVLSHSCIDGSVVGSGASVGPYARLRPGTVLGDSVKIGNFVETKKARLQDGAKASHLSYLGDAEIGADANIGAGTITCNYDGKNKHKTEIGSKAFIGSNTAIVAPVVISQGATIAAGSVITKDVEEDSLAIARAKQRNLGKWSRD